MTFRDMMNSEFKDAAIPTFHVARQLVGHLEFRIPLKIAAWE